MLFVPKWWCPRGKKTKITAHQGRALNDVWLLDTYKEVATASGDGARNHGDFAMKKSQLQMNSSQVELTFQCMSLPVKG
jgi:hypothetical protein